MRFLEGSYIWDMLNAVVDVSEWLKNKLGWERSEVTIKYPQGDWPVYVPGEDYIEMPEPGFFTFLGSLGTPELLEGVIYHEYGHAVLWSIYGIRAPYGPGPKKHFIYSESSKGFAFNEGFAYFLEQVVRRELKKSGSSLFDWPLKEADIEKNTWYNVIDSGDMDGDIVEGSVASILWDIYDGMGDDTINSEFRKLWDVLVNDKPQNIHQFRTAWLNRYSSLYEKDLEEIYTLYGVPTITVISPNGGEIWDVGSTQIIRWRSVGVSGNVRIELSLDNGKNWTSIIANTTNDGSEPWTVTGPMTPQARIRVVSLNDPDILDTSNKSFSIRTQVGALQVTIEPAGARNAGAQWRLTSGPDTSWKNSGATVSNLPVGTYTVTFKDIPGWIKPADTTVTINANQTTTLSRTYTQSGPPTIVSVTTLPNTITQGATVTLTYTVTNPGLAIQVLLGASIRLPGGPTLSDPNNDRKVTLATGTNTITRSFVVPATAPSGTYDLLVSLVEDLNNNGRIDSGDRNLDFKTFTGALIVSAARLTFTDLQPYNIETSESTHIAELKATGSNFTNVVQIIWSWSGPDSDTRVWNRGDSNWNEKVELRSDTFMILRPVVLYNVSGTQPKTWYWTVTLKDATGATASRQFTVTWRPPAVPRITVTSPNGAEVWTVGSTRTITWTSSNLNPAGKIYIFYWYNNNWVQIAGPLSPTTTSFTWIVPNTPITSTRIFVGNWVNNTWEASDTSDNPFTIK
jgi:hypothetical protein